MFLTNLAQAYPYFAIIYLDDNGEIRVQTSRNLAEFASNIFSKYEIGRFLQTTACQGGNGYGV